MDKEHIERLFRETTDLMCKKNDDYSGGSGSNLDIAGVPGIAVRLLDKATRLYNLTHSGKDPSFESLRDTFMDTINYSAIGESMLTGHWNVKPDTAYIAGAIDFIGNEAACWFETAKEKLEAYGILCFSPYHAYTQLRGKWTSGMKAYIDAINRAAIRGCDAFIAHLVRSKFTVGTIRDLEYASSLGKRVIVVSYGSSIVHSCALYDVEIVDTIDSVVKLLVT